jgi:hypothetical protein
MQRRVLFVAVGVGLAARVLPAQETRRQDRAPVAVPAYTDQQRLDRATLLTVSFIIAGIAQTKSRGERAEDYGGFVGDFFAPSWGPPNTGHAVRMARRVLFNLAGFAGSDAQIVSASDTSATLRYRRFHTRQFGPQREIRGVTLDEYDRAASVIYERIASHLGLRYERRIDGEWDVVTIRGRGGAAVVDFPRATYTVTLSQQDAAGRPELAGTWEVSYGPDGRYTVRQNGETKVQGAYDVRLDELALRDETGPLACDGQAKYRWSVNPTGELVLGQLFDACEARAQVLTRRALSRK